MDLTDRCVTGLGPTVDEYSVPSICWSFLFFRNRSDLVSGARLFMVGGSGEGALVSLVVATVRDFGRRFLLIF